MGRMVELLAKTDILMGCCDAVEASSPGEMLTLAMFNRQDLYNQLQDTTNMLEIQIELDTKRLTNIRETTQCLASTSQRSLVLPHIEWTVSDQISAGDRLATLRDLLDSRGFSDEVDLNNLASLYQREKDLKKQHKLASGQLNEFHGLPVSVPEATIFVAAKIKEDEADFERQLRAG